MGVFGSIVATLMENNAFHLFFPWMLILTITYGALNRYDVFEEDATTGVAALSVAFISIGGIYQFAPPSMFANFAAALAFGAFGIFGLLVLFAVAGVDPTDSEEQDGNWTGLLAIGALVIGIVSFVGVIASQLDIEALLGGVENGFQEVVMPILILVFILIVVTSVGGDDSGE
ncbi:MAG: hypothetical protein ABEJ98_05960 [Candidatus Nanohaloarchaea archaeon]